MASVATATDARPWRDPKRYAWLLGLLDPDAAVPRVGPRRRDRPRRLLVLRADARLRASSRRSTCRSAWTRATRPTSVIKWLEQDRYYRWCTYLYLPIQYAGLVFACWLWSHGHLSTIDSVGLALTVAMVSGIAINTAHELGHKRASDRALAQPRRARAERLRALLHRAQPRPPRARRHARGSRQRAPRRELLRVPAAHRARQPALRLGARARAPARDWTARRGACATTSSARGR